VNWFGHIWPEITSPTWLIKAGPQLSVEVTAAMLTGGTAFAQDTVTPAGHVKVGGVISLTVIN
jgi:hypothetical protein